LYDFAVIGAGMAGVSLADALTEHASVVLLDSEAQPGYHSTGRSAALFAPNYGSTAFCALTRASAPFMHAPPAGFVADALLHARGALTIARKDQRAQLAATIAHIRACGSHVEVLGEEAARALVPVLRKGYIEASAFEPDVHDIDVEGLLRGFLKRARARGLQTLFAARIETPRRNGGAWELQAGAEIIKARVLINCAGAWADELAGRCGARPLGLQPLRRTAALIDAPPRVPVTGWPAIFDVDEDFYVKPDAGRLLVSPGDEEPMAPCDAWADDLTVATAIDRMQVALDIEVDRVAHNWAGLRTFAPDRDPVVGFDRVLQNFFWCAGQGGYGIQTAPALSRLAAALARGEPVPPDIAAEGVTEAAVSPARFS
jgi:D-arginine dehydrogenase